MPRTNEAGFLSIEGFLTNNRPRAIPKIVESSASPFIDEPTTSPLRPRMARRAMVDVVTPDIRPKRRNDNTIGIPVKSNLRKGSHGKRIFRAEYFIVKSKTTTRAPRTAVPPRVLVSIFISSLIRVQI